MDKNQALTQSKRQILGTTGRQETSTSVLWHSIFGKTLRTKGWTNNTSGLYTKPFHITMRSKSKNVIGYGDSRVFGVGLMVRARAKNNNIVL